MRDSYPSDISREQPESIQTLFEQAKKRARLRVVSLVRGEKTTFVTVDSRSMKNTDTAE